MALPCWVLRPATDNMLVHGDWHIRSYWIVLYLLIYNLHMSANGWTVSGHVTTAKVSEPNQLCWNSKVDVVLDTTS